ncbi:MAG: 16S rRNA processing protein RimM [Nitrospinae bacterium]|nr:16S rRNA processing protein RimM [Nitrospinota bacterium]
MAHIKDPKGKTEGGAVGPSPAKGIMVAVGRFIKPHGVQGELKLIPFFEEVIRGLVGEPIEASTEDGSSPPLRFTIKSIRGAGVSLIVKLSGLDSPESAGALKNTLMRVERSRMPDLDDGYYYFEEIIGLPVFDVAGNSIGKLVSFFPAGERDVWVIKPPKGEDILLPCIPETIVSVDVKNGKIIVKPMETVE